MLKPKDITNDKFIEAYQQCKSKAHFFRIIKSPDNTTWRRWFNYKQKELNLAPLERGYANWSNNFKNSDEEFIKIVDTSYSIRESLMKLGLNPNGANYSGFKNRVKSLSINTDHFTGQGHLKGRTHSWGNSRPLEEILVRNSDYSSTSGLKRKLLNSNMFEPKCYNCGLTDWLGNPISLQIDHINGVNNDHRLKNLRLLCPNCHSQTPTYAGKNKRGSLK